VDSAAKLLETSHGLGTGSPRESRHRAPAARERGEGRERAGQTGICAKSLKNLFLDVFLAVDHDSDLKK